MKTTEPDKKNDGFLPAWDLGDLFASRDSSRLAEALTEAEAEARIFAEKYQGKIAKLSGGQLGTAIEAYEKISERLERIAAFITLTVAANGDESAWGRALQECLRPAARQLLFFGLEINRMKEAEILDKISAPQLARYGAWLRRNRSLRDHQLGDELEKYAHEKSAVAEDAWTRLFDMTLAQLRASVRGKDLTVQETLRLIVTAGDPLLRREAYAELGRVLGQNKKVFALIVNTLADLKAADDEQRNFSNPEDARHLANQIEPETVNAMAKAVRESYPGLAHRYYAWKAKKFGVVRLHPADRNVLLPGSKSGGGPWEEAENAVLDAWRKFSPQLAGIGRQFFDRGWIDAQPRANKDGGAFSHPAVPAVHPYILINYQGCAGDVQTLARELGKGIQQVLAAGQGYLQSTPPQVLSETAGAFGALLVFHELLDREKDLGVRRGMIARKIEDMLDAVAGQTALFTFEQKVHQERKNKGELSPERLAQLWQETQKDSLGPAVNLDTDGAENFWMSVPHPVHAPFGGYAAAFGECVANALYAEYAKTDDQPGFVQKYTGLLQAGGAQRPDAALAGFGFDASDPQFWKKSLAVIEGYIDALMALDRKIEAIQKTRKDFKDTASDIAVPPKPKAPDNEYDPRGPAL